jgi:23S rRNA (guanosine2251-2'-O)-methyltransferase
MSSRLILNGLRSIEECLKVNPERVTKILVPGSGMSPRIQSLRSHAQKLGIKVESNPKADPEEPVLAFLKDYEYFDFDQLVSLAKDEVADGKNPVILVLDGLSDPHNLGAIVRTAAFMGIFGIVLPKDRSVSVTGTVYHIASGGLEYVKLCQVTNLATALSTFKDAGFWVVGLSEHAKTTSKQLKRDFPVVLAIGNEEKGLRPLILKSCDHLISLQSKGGLKSLNASVAAALAMDWAVY